mmetsp:Transcript_86173/g.164828  ORF Transcript_86173/g.164828 Transcript_86173/m.164828 type:complete len:81 (-) Transcript_86173:248-490(-)
MSPEDVHGRLAALSLAEIEELRLRCETAISWYAEESRNLCNMGSQYVFVDLKSTTVGNRTTCNKATSSGRHNKVMSFFTT